MKTQALIHALSTWSPMCPSAAIVSGKERRLVGIVRIKALDSPCLSEDRERFYLISFLPDKDQS